MDFFCWIRQKEKEKSAMQNEIKLRTIVLSGYTKTDQAITQWRKDEDIPKHVEIKKYRGTIEGDEEMMEFYRVNIQSNRVDFILILRTIPESFNKINILMSYNRNKRFLPIEKPMHTIYSLADPVRETRMLRNKLCNAINGRHVTSMLVIGDVVDNDLGKLKQVLCGAITQKMFASIPEKMRHAHIVMGENAKKLTQLKIISMHAKEHNKGLLQNITEQIKVNYLKGTGPINEMKWVTWGKGKRKNKIFS